MARKWQLRCVTHSVIWYMSLSTTYVLTSNIAHQPPALIVHNNKESVLHIYLGTGNQVHHHNGSLGSAGDASTSNGLIAASQAVENGWWYRLKGFLCGMKPAWNIDVLYTQSSWLNYVRQNAFSLSWKAALIVYCALNYRLFLVRSYLRQPTRWLAWKKFTMLRYMPQIDTADLVHDLIVTLRIREGIVSSEQSDEEVICRIIDEITEELRALDTYSFYADNIRWLSDIQQHGALLCEGYIPPLGGIPWGSMMRLAVQKMTLGSLVYLDARLLEEVAEYRHRLMYMRELLEYAPKNYDHDMLKIK